MSLFKTRESWSTICGQNEQYDNGCMVSADILSKSSDCLIIGSHTGILRIFQPASVENDSLDYRPTDLLIETQLHYPIIQINVGKFVSGSQSLQLGVLHPQSVAVYSLASYSGSAQHGDYYELILAYEHQLQKSAFSFIIGPFGGVIGRDFISIQSLDGSLSFFEQETFSVSRNLSCFLLPSAVVYVPSSDSFIIIDANWTLQCFRYELLADSSRKLMAWWSQNVGEPVIDMQVVAGPGGKASVWILGERHLFCLREGGGVDSVRRLQYSPRCLHAYVVEPDGRSMVMVVADTATLLIYDLSSLCWSSQLPFVPVSISRVNIKNVKGLVALLSEDGHVVCCHLGTEPAVFTAPPISSNILTYEDLQQKHSSLQEEINSTFQNADGGSHMKASEGPQLIVTTRAVLNAAEDCCQLLIQLGPAPGTTTAFGSTQITVSVTPPLVAHPFTHHLPTLGERTEMSSLVTLLDTHTIPVLTTDAHVAVVCIIQGGGSCVVHTTTALPAALVLTPVAPAKEAEYKITLALSQPTVPLDQLFTDLVGEEWVSAGCSEGVMGLAPRVAFHQTTTVVVSKASARYRVQADSLAAMNLVLTQLTSRIEAYYAARQKPVTVSYPATSFPLTPLLDTVDRHVELRRSIISMQEMLAKQTTQYRTIQRRLLSRLREKTVQPLVSLDKFLAETYKQISKTAYSLQATQLALEVCSCELGCLVRLALGLARLCDSTSAKDWTDFAAAISNVQHSSETQAWEEVCESGVNYLLSTSLAKSVRDHQRTALDPLRDTARFKKHIAVALDRVVAGCDPNTKQDPPRVSPIMEREEYTTINPQTDDYGAELSLV